MFKRLQSASARLQIFLPGIGYDKSSRATVNEEEAKVFLKPGQSAANRGSRQLEMVCRSRQRTRLPDRNEHAHIIQIQSARLRLKLLHVYLHQDYHGVALMQS